jgi:hypothetical protein
MVRTTMRATFAALALGYLALVTSAPTAKAAHPDLFYNHYQGPTACGDGTPVQLYVGPRPTPPLVGHTYITYQPLMPHEFLYCHHRTYHKYYRNGGYTTACIRWH